MRIRFDNFSGGLNKQGENASLSPSEYRIGKDLKTDTGGLKLVGGMANLFASRAGTITGFTRFVNSSGVSYIVFGQSDNSTHTVYAYNESTTTITSLGSNFPAGIRLDFLATDNYLYIAGATDLQYWDGDVSHSIALAGVPTPASIAIVDSLAGSGSLDNSANHVPYQYVYTYENDRGLEGNPSPAGVGFDATGEDATLHAPAYTPDTGITLSWVNFYRIGGSLEDYLYAGRSAFVSATDVSFVDDTADVDMPARTPPSNHGYPPSNLLGLTLHDGRMWGYIENKIYYSEKANYEFFTEFTQATDIDGGILELDTPNSNNVVCFTSIGSVLIVGSIQTIHSIMWDGEAYRARKESNQGVLSRRGMCRADNSVYYIGRDLQVYRLGDAQGISITEKIKDSLKVNTVYVPGDYRAGCIEYHERKVIFCMGAAQSYRVHIDTGIIEGLDNALFAAMEFKSLPNLSGRYDLFMGPYSGYSGASTYNDIGGSAYRGIVKVLSDAIGATLPVQYKTDKLDMGNPRQRKRCQRLQFFGSITQGSPAVSVNLYLDGGSAKNIALTGTSGTLLDTKLPFSYTFKEIEIEFTGKASAIDIKEIVFDFSLLEEAAI